MAPTFINGIKRTLPSRYPDALVCDLETLRDAPKEMTVAGVGDLLAVFVSLPDWYMAYRLGLDSGYSELAQHLIGPLDEIFLSKGEEISRGSLEGILVLAKLNSLGGLAMSLSHSTAPLSGYEHIMSHILDLLAERSSRPLAMHGTQVALTSILGAAAYQHFLAELKPGDVIIERCYPEMSAMESLIQQTFVKVDPTEKAGGECWADYRIKLEGWSAHRPQFESFLDDWPLINEKIHLLCRSPERLISILQLIQAPLKFDELNPPASEEDVRFAFLNSPLMRKRLTLGDLLIFLGWNREVLWSQLRSYVIRNHPKHVTNQLKDK
jgi:glycerol-1-phosphate dehydrogenase [NAD(P)+]